MPYLTMSVIFNLLEQKWSNELLQSHCKRSHNWNCLSFSLWWSWRIPFLLSDNLQWHIIVVNYLVLSAIWMQFLCHIAFAGICFVLIKGKETTKILHLIKIDFSLVFHAYFLSRKMDNEMHGMRCKPWAMRNMPLIHPRHYLLQKKKLMSRTLFLYWKMLPIKSEIS